MDIQERKIHFIQEFLKYSNDNLLTRFEELLQQEREKSLEDELKPMTLKEYESRIERAVDDVKNNKVKIARDLKNEIATWK
ncbi:MAG: hypothetical protein WCP85_05280 [Mariniphaga sp.]